MNDMEMNLRKYDTLTRSQRERERIKEKAVEMFGEVTACDPELSTTMACEAVGRKLKKSRLTIWRIVKEAGLC